MSEIARAGTHRRAQNRGVYRIRSEHSRWGVGSLQSVTGEMRRKRWTGVGCAGSGRRTQQLLNLVVRAGPHLANEAFHCLMDLHNIALVMSPWFNVFASRVFGPEAAAFPARLLYRPLARHL